MENLKQKALQAHKMWKGKVEVIRSEERRVGKECRL